MSEHDSTAPQADTEAPHKPLKTKGRLMFVSHAKLTTTDQQRTHYENSDGSIGYCDADKELIESVKVHGVMQPILIRQMDDAVPSGPEYLVVAGHRRLMASRAAGYTTIPALCVTMDEDEAEASQLVENLQREPLSLADTSAAVWNLYIGAANYSAGLLASMIGKSKSWVSKMLMLSSPTKASTVARSLIAADKLGDLELAYLICQVEELNKDVAQTIGKNIENETRATVKEWLKQVRKQAADVQADDSEGESSSTESGEEPILAQDDLHTMSVSLSSHQWSVLRQILDNCEVSPVQLGHLQAIRTAFQLVKEK